MPPRVNTRGAGIDAAITEAVEIIASAYDRQYGLTRLPEMNDLLRGPERFGERLRALRLRHRISVPMIAAALEIGNATLERYERGDVYPRFEVLPRIAAYFGVSLDWLIIGEA